MPLPKPTSGQTRDDFMSSCMANATMINEYPDNDQRYAVCNSIWNENKEKMKEFKYGHPCSIIKDLDLKNRIVKAYYFNAKNIDSDGDLIEISAYDKSVNENGPKSSMPRIKHLFNHWDGAGILQELGTDDEGGWFVSKLGRHTIGRDTLLMYEDGLITEHSHGFETINSTTETRDGQEIRIIKEGKLWEVTSLDKWGANMHTPVIKSLEDRSYWEKRIEKLIKAFNSGSYTDETFELLEYQLKQIKELIRIYDMEPGQLPTSKEAGSQPTSGKEPDWSKIILTNKKIINYGIRI